MFIINSAVMVGTDGMWQITISRNAKFAEPPSATHWDCVTVIGVNCDEAIRRAVACCDALNEKGV